MTGQVRLPVFLFHLFFFIFLQFLVVEVMVDVSFCLFFFSLTQPNPLLIKLQTHTKTLSFGLHWIITNYLLLLLLLLNSQQFLLSPSFLNQFLVLRLPLEGRMHE